MTATVNNKHHGLKLMMLTTVLMMSMLLAILTGAFQIHIGQIIDGILGQLGAQDKVAFNVFLSIRLPRVIFSLVVGASLATCGVAAQALFRNPLADPGLIGISSGAALGAVVAIVFTNGGFVVVSAAAFLGSFGAGLLAYAFGRRYEGMAGLLLAGIAINAIAGSLVGLTTYIANDIQLRDYTFWSMGSLARVDWSILSWIVPWTVVCLFYFMRQWRALNALLLGNHEAEHLGFPVRQLRRKLLFAIALLVGPLVALTGGIAFVGLVVPHIMRMLLGANHRILLPSSMLAGGIGLVLADVLARTVIVPAELPIGLITALVGGPFFFWLLTKGRHT